MRYEIGPTSCRVCLQPDKKVRSIYKVLEEGEETPNEMLVQLLGAGFSKLSGSGIAPEIICRECELSLNMAFQFRERALKMQCLIEEYCRENGIDFDENGSVEELFIKEEGDHSLDEEPQLMEEVMQENMANYGGNILTDGQEQIYQLSNKEDMEVNIDIDSNDNEPTENIALVTGEEIEYLDEESPYLEVVSQPIEYEHDNSNDIALTNELRSLEKRVKRSSARLRKADNPIVKKEKQSYIGSFICDVCGNVYEKRGRMLEHRRRHDIVQHYQCELCEKRFPAREQLRKHIYSHTGSKPFKCSFCSRTFFYESVLKSHENVHRGVKPYVCRICNKAFAYSHSLNIHELIHNNIKKYHCTFCNKDFRLQHHMRQHEETKCHQNAVALAMKQEPQDAMLQSE